MFVCVCVFFFRNFFSTLFAPVQVSIEKKHLRECYDIDFIHRVHKWTRNGRKHYPHMAAATPHAYFLQAKPARMKSQRLIWISQSEANVANE